MEGKMMRASYKWKVVINAGYFMAGTHRFKTKKASVAFVDAWLKANPMPGYSEVETPDGGFVYAGYSAALPIAVIHDS